MSESRELYNDLIELIGESLDAVTVIIVNGDGGEISSVCLSSGEEKDDYAQTVPFADGVGIFIHFGVIDAPPVRGVTVFDGVTSGVSK